MYFVQKLIFFIIFSMMLVAFLANPAPESIEIADLILIVLPFTLGIFCLYLTNG